MPNIIGTIIAIARSIGKSRRYLKKRNASNDKTEQKWILLQNKIRAQLISSFDLTDADVINYPNYLETHYTDLEERLSQINISEFDKIISEMRQIEMFLRGMIAGYQEHSQNLGNYEGLVYASARDCPFGGEYDDCDLILVSRQYSQSHSKISYMAEHYGRAASEEIVPKNVANTLGFSDNECGPIVVTSLLH
jgi:hypothetical protein